jgi:hypothetical protein
MRVRAINNNDYAFGVGDAAIIGGDQAVLLKCKTVLRQIKGEWFLAQNDGFAWGNKLGHAIDADALRRDIRQILGDIAQVKDVSISVTGRAVAVVVKIRLGDHVGTVAETFSI